MSVCVCVHSIMVFMSCCLWFLHSFSVMQYIHNNKSPVTCTLHVFSWDFTNEFHSTADHTSLCVSSGEKDQECSKHPPHHGL